jgi:tetratricopeptide (TPR) repeat protein
MHLATLFSWAEQEARPYVIIATVAALSSYYDLLGEWISLLAIQQTAIDAAELVGDRWAVMATKNRIAWFVSQRGQYEKALQMLADALVLAKAFDDPAWLGEILLSHSIVLRRSGKVTQALSYCQQALPLVQRLPSDQQPFEQAEIDYELGKIARDQQDWETALAYFIKAQAVFRADDDEEEPAFNLERAWGTLGQIAFVKHHLGEHEEAIQLYHKALALCHDTVSKGFIVTLSVRLASLEEQRGNTSVALKYAHEALEWSKRLGMVQEREQAEALLHRLEA